MTDTPDEEEGVLPTYVEFGDNTAILYDAPIEVNGQKIFAVAFVGGDLYLGLCADFKLHKLETAKGMTTEKAVTAIRPKLATKQGQQNAVDSRSSDDS